MSAKKFSHFDYDQLVEEVVEKIKELSTLKGGEYAGDTDRLANFRRNAEAAGVTMEQCWRIYTGKHWDAISQFIQDQANGRNRTRLEPISGRVDDLIVYAILFKAMLIESGHHELKAPSLNPSSSAKPGDAKRPIKVGPSSAQLGIISTSFSRRLECRARSLTSQMFSISARRMETM